jgi:hypothetical protein
MTMRITKRQLRRVIQEQMGSTSYEPLKTAAEWVEHLGQLIDQDMTERNVDLRDEGSELIEALEMLRREYKDEISGPNR